MFWRSQKGLRCYLVGVVVVEGRKEKEKRMSNAGVSGAYFDSDKWTPRYQVSSQEEEMDNFGRFINPGLCTQNENRGIIKGRVLKTSAAFRSAQTPIVCVVFVEDRR